MQIDNLNIKGYALDENIVRRKEDSVYYISEQNEDYFFELHYPDNDQEKRSVVALIYKRCELDEVFLFHEGDNIEKELNNRI